MTQFNFLSDPAEKALQISGGSLVFRERENPNE